LGTVAGARERDLDETAFELLPRLSQATGADGGRRADGCR
jgi:hypothetical protein